MVRKKKRKAICKIGGVDKLENGDNSSKNDNIPDLVINQCIDTKFKLLDDDIPEQVEDNSDIISDDTEHQTSGSSDMCQEKDNRSFTSSETNSNDTFKDKEIEFLEQVHKEQISNMIRERKREKQLLRNNKSSTSQDQEPIQKNLHPKSIRMFRRTY